MTYLQIYKQLKSNFGFLNWWPASTPYEMILGAILTQNTSWKNVEKALITLKEHSKLEPQAILEIDDKTLAKYIQSAGFFNQKTQYIKNVSYFLEKYPIEDLKKIKDIYELRNKLLKIKGLGKESVDSILLYALDKPIFVIDAYTKRIFFRLGLVKQDIEYDDLQKIFHKNLKNDLILFQDFHAQIVELAKNYCTKTKAKCNYCPLKKICPTSIT